MKRLLAGSALALAAAVLSGCYYDPGYVRSGGAYYGQGSTVVYDDGYAPYYYGCCYDPGVVVGVGTVWYGGPRYYDRYRPGYRYVPRGGWYGGGPGPWRGHGPPPRGGPGPWRGHAPPPHGHPGGEHGWTGGHGDHR